MPPEQTRVIELTEYQPLRLPHGELPQTAAQTWARHYSAQVSVESPILDPGHWRVASQGWVGYIPLTQQIGISLQPKVPLYNLFRMLELAYSLDSVEFIDDLYQSDSLNDFYERLAKLLAQHILDRFRKGIHRSYMPYAEQLPFVKGSIDMAGVSRRPWQILLPCHYEEHTPDTEDNQILAWALHRIQRSGLCTEKSLPTVRAAHRRFHGLVTHNPFRPRDCVGREYSRLNADYRPLHALSYFFLDDSGPSHRLGEQTMLPFLINMANLYEQFVAKWLNANMPAPYTLRTQERFTVDPATGLHFNIDLVVRDSTTDSVSWVMDTKYKAPTGGPSTDDIQQGVTYATAKGAHDAILVYPVPLTQPLNQRIGEVRVRTLTFALDGDLEAAGHSFLSALLPAVPQHATTSFVD
jgi:5-methylcytosine-specific restriction enzyme subunit McrC